MRTFFELSTLGVLSPMELVRGLHNLRERHNGCVLSIGNFDGVHLGHQALIERLKQRATESRVPATVMVFEPTPREFFRPDLAPGRVATFRGKIGALRQAGVERVVCARFNREFSETAAVDFVTEILVRQLGIKAVVVGDDFRFGLQRSGDVSMLKLLGRAHGFSAESVDTVIVDGRRASSSALREALSAAELELAAKLLGRPYAMTGRVRRGLALGRKLDMRTANIVMHRKPALRYGVYVVEAFAEGRQWQGVASLGVRPTLGDDRACLLETHLLGNAGELYGETLEVRFRHFLRPEKKFDSLDELGAQMHADADQARQWFAERK